MKVVKIEQAVHPSGMVLWGKFYTLDDPNAAVRFIGGPQCYQIGDEYTPPVKRNS